MTKHCYCMTKMNLGLSKSNNGAVGNTKNSIFVRLLSINKYIVVRLITIILGLSTIKPII